MPDSLVSFTIQDEIGKKAQIPVFLIPGLTISQYTEFVAAHAANIDLICGGQIVAATLQLDLALPAGLKASAVNGSRVAVGGLFNFLTPGRFTHSVRIPALGEPLVTSGGGINTADADVADWIDDLVTGVAVTGGSALPTNGHSEDLASFSSGKYSVRRK